MNKLVNKVAVCHNAADNTDVILSINEIKEIVPINNGDPYIRVDYFDYEMTKIIEVDNHKIMMQHGHKIFLNKDNIVAHANKNKCNSIKHLNIIK